MIKRLLVFALNQRGITLAGIGIIIAAGIWSWISLRKEAYPDVGDTQVTVIATYPGRAASEVEQQVTLPIERALNAVPRVINRRSKTIFGLAVVQLTFEDGTEDYFARQQVLERLAGANLPDGVSPELGPLTGPVGEIFRYVIEAPVQYTPMDLRTLQDWTIIPRLLQVPGVADVVNFGGLVKQYHVITSPEKLVRYNLTLQAIIDAINANNLNTGGNIVERGEQGLAVRGIGAIHSRRDIENIVITATGGVPVFIRDVASVEEHPLPPAGVLGYAIREPGGRMLESDAGVQGLIAMRRGENASEVVEALKAAVDDINANDLPEGVRLRVTYDRSELVDYTIDTVSHTLIEGVTIVVLVLIFFLGSVRSALVVVTTIPIALLFAFTMMKATGIPANLLSLGAIDFGIIVDGAVVMAENILRRLSHLSDEDRAQGIIRTMLSSAQEVGREIFFSISIIILAYLPIFSFQRVEGKLFSPMAYTLSYAIAGSMLLALTLIPVLMSFLYRRHVEQEPSRPVEWRNPVYHWLEGVYGKALERLTRRPLRTAVLAGILVLVTGVAGYRLIGTEFLPELDEGAINIRCFFPVGISLTQAQTYAPIVRRTIANHPQVKTVLTQLGRNDDGTDPYGPNRMEIMVGLNDYSTWTKDTSKAVLLAVIKRELEAAVPGALFSFSQPILDNVTEAVTGSVADLAILINGPDLALMRAKADSILAIIRTIPGATESGIEQEGNQAQLAIDIDRTAAARYGINVSDIQKMIEAAIGGRAVSKLYDGSKLFDIVVRYASTYRSSVDAVTGMLVTSPTGARIPLSRLATIRLVDGPTIIQRDDGQRQISVRTNIRGRDQGSFVAEAQQRVAAGVTIPRGYAVSWGGQFENLSRATHRLALVIPLTVGIIFLVLFSLYRNVRHVAIAMSSMFFAIVGGLAALVLRGDNFNVSSGVGMISLFGVSIMAGVLYVSRVNRLQDDFNLALTEAARRAAVIQFRPLLMTMVLALLGLIPAMFASGIGSDVQRPLATVIVGGLCSSLLLTPLALPAITIAAGGRHRQRIGQPPLQQGDHA